jgi:hypothetical protein
VHGLVVVDIRVDGDVAMDGVGSGHAVSNLRVAVRHSGGHRAMGAVGNSVIVGRRVDSDLAVRLGDSGKMGGRGTSWGEQSGEGQLLDRC